MSSIESNNQSLNNILEKIGVKSSENAAVKPKSSLGQEDFLKLMTTQLQNQDPFAPMENGEFIAKMAQFSTVTGITEMGQALKGISDKMSEFRIAAASAVGYTLSAVPVGGQADDDCGTLTLTNAGVRAPAGCWD